MGVRLVLGLVGVAAIVTLAALLLRPHSSERPSPLQVVVPADPPAARNSHVFRSDPSQNTLAADPATRLPAETGGRNSLTLLGVVQSSAQSTLSTRLPARIAAVYVREGEQVPRGRFLVQLDSTEIRSQEQTAQAGVAAAQAQVRKARSGREAQRVKADADVQSAQDGLRQARLKLQQAILGRDTARDADRADLVAAQLALHKAEAALAHAQDSLHSLEELSKVGGVSRADLEGARTEVITAQSDRDTAAAQVQRLTAGPPRAGGSYRVAQAQQEILAARAGVQQAQHAALTAQQARREVLAVTAQDIGAAEAAVAQAQAGVSGAQSARNTTRLVSPIRGVVASVMARVGETAQPGGPLVTVVSLTGLRVEALVPARQLALLHPGQAARVEVETLPGRAFPAYVSEIAQVAEPDGRTFRVTFRFHMTQAPLRPGQTARIVVTH